MKKILMLLTLATTFLGSTAAMADRKDHDRHDAEKQRGEMKHEHREHHDDDDKYGDEKHYKKAPPAHAKAWGHASRQFKQGERLPKEYRSNRYNVTDWESRKLDAPPAGYRWTEVDGKYLLVSAANNVISKIVYGR